MSSLKTKLSVSQIQLALRNSDLFNPTRDLIVPNLITEILYKDHLIAMVYERRDNLNWTETNCIDLKPLLD